MKYWDLYQHFKDQGIVSSQDIKNYFGDINPVQLSQWTNKGLIIQLKRGLYLIKGAEIDRFIIANQLKNSYISLETALAYYQLIPETVYQVLSVTTEKPETITNPEGSFLYYHLKPALFFDYQLIESKIKNRFFKIALPEKALFDLIYFRTDLNDQHSLTEIRLTKFNFSLAKFRLYLKLVNHQAIKNRLNNLINFLKKYA